ncbi:hypothetical protein [Amycolatopsis sp. WAC 04182]|uniref:hypothetical protein n=1 Tax=Amycolatopsis sp. WAC 04182 TaxID=2203198 RepID=UPI000F79DABF|nr:hypothetical protein [Amycolatopsis sp. WAC 04182]
MGVIAVVCVIAWLYLRRRRKWEVGVALAAVAVVVAFGLPVLAKPIEDAWSPVTDGKQPEIAELAPPVPPPGQPKPAIGPGWGPPRQLFTLSHPATYSTFNSITDNSFYGDERSFYRVRHSAQDCKESSSPWRNHEKIAEGDYLAFQVFVENSAADSLDKDGSHTVRNLRLKINFPALVGDPKTGSAGQAETSAVLTAENANPDAYWFVVLLSSDSAVRLDLVPGRNRLLTNHFSPDGLEVPDSFLHAPGLQLGFDKLDGRLRPGYYYALYLSFCMKVTKAAA